MRTIFPYIASAQIFQETHQQVPELVSLGRGKDVGAMHCTGEYLEGFRLRRSLVHGLHHLPVAQANQPDDTVQLSRGCSERN